MGYQIRDLGLALGLSGASHKSFARMLRSLYELFVQEDCAMVEINPLVRTVEDEMVALDAKVSFDENAEFRHKNWDDLRDLSLKKRMWKFERRRPASPMSNSMETLDVWLTEPA